MTGAREIMRALDAVYQPHGYNVGLNVGEAGGAGIREHLHLHVVPRWRGDTNFTTVTGDLRVIPESLENAWEKLQEAMASLAGGGRSA
jgi:ATP adenylyltransferase